MANVQLHDLGAAPEAVTLADLAEGRVPAGDFAVRLTPPEDVRALTPYLKRLSAVVLVFPGFKDGRPFSSARILRDHLDFTGDLWAVGSIVPDHALYYERAGFSAVETRSQQERAAAEHALSVFPAVYQRAADARVPVWALRHPS